MSVVSGSGALAVVLVSLALVVGGCGADGSGSVDASTGETGVADSTVSSGADAQDPGDDAGGSSGADPGSASVDLGTPGAACTWPEAPAGVASVFYVGSFCTGEGADGSRYRPFGTLAKAQAALDGVAEGAILLAAGEQVDDLRINKGRVHVIGPVDSAGNPGSTISGGAANGAAVLVEGDGELILVGVRVALGPAAGVLARAGAYLELRESKVDRNGGVGVMMIEARGIILNNLVADNAGGGIRVEKALKQIRIEGNTVQGNHRFGISASELVGIILNNLVKDTSVAVGDPGGALVADGIQLLGPRTDVEVQGNTIEGNGRVGLLMRGELVGIILNNLVASNGRAGIWMEAGAGNAAGRLQVEGNTVRGNGFVGIGMTGESVGIILNNLVSATAPGEPEREGEVSMGDGIGVFAGARAEVRGNDATGNTRCGIIVDDADPDTIVVENTASGNGYGIVVQGQLNYATGAEPDGTPRDNTESDNDNLGTSDGLDLPVASGELGTE